MNTNACCEKPMRRLDGDGTQAGASSRYDSFDTNLHSIECCQTSGLTELGLVPTLDGLR